MKKHFTPFKGCSVATMCGSVFVILGCGGGAPAPQTQPAAVPAATTATQQTATEATTQTSAVTGGTKWLGKVPYDVFYDRPLDKIGQAPELGATVSSVATMASTPNDSAMASSSTPTGTAAPASNGADTTGGDNDAWSSVISAEVLDAESKVIRSRLSAALQSLSTYNRSIDAITNDAIIMSAVAGVAENYDADMRWKDRAPTVRTLAYEVYENVGDKGRKAFTATQVPFEKMATLLNGGNVDGIEVDEDVPFADYADRSSLMSRVDSTFKWLRSTIVSDANLKSNQEDVVREASVLAMIAAMIKHDSYDYHEEKEYQKFCNDFLNASRDASNAAEQMVFSDFQDAISRINTSCNECHNQYAFGDDGL